jgi:hypothetical protein
VGIEREESPGDNVGGGEVSVIGVVSSAKEDSRRC